MDGQSLQSGTVLGGAIITISGDLSSLRASGEETKRLVGDLGRLSATVPLKLDISSLERQATQAVQVIQQAVALMKNELSLLRLEMPDIGSNRGNPNFGHLVARDVPMSGLSTPSGRRRQLTEWNNEVEGEERHRAKLTQSEVNRLGNSDAASTARLEDRFAAAIERGLVRGAERGEAKALQVGNNIRKFEAAQQKLEERDTRPLEDAVAEADEIASGSRSDRFANRSNIIRAGRGGLLSLQGLTRRLGGGILMYEGLRLASDYQGYLEGNVLAGTDQRQLYGSQEKLVSSIESIPLIGQAAGMVAEDLTKGKLLGSATTQAAEATDAYTNTMKSSQEFRLAELGRHQITQSPNHFASEEATVNEEYRQRTQKIRDDRDARSAAALHQKQEEDVLAQSRADKKTTDFLWRRGALMRLTAPVLFPGYVRDLNDAFATRELAANQQNYSSVAKKISDETAPLLNDADADKNKKLRIVAAEHQNYLTNIAENTRLMSAESQGAMLTAKGESRDAFVLVSKEQRQSQMVELRGQISAAYARDDKEGVNTLTKQFETQFGKGGIGGTSQQSIDAQLLQMDKRNAAERLQLEGEASANRLRLVHDTLGAELVLLEKEKEAKLSVADASQKAAIESAYNSSIAVKKQEIAEHDATMAANTSTAFDVSTARLNRDSNTATLRSFDNETATLLRNAKPGDVSSISTSRDYERQAIVAEQQFQLEQQGKDLTAEKTSADQFTAGQRNRAGFTRQTRQIISQFEQAPPELKQLAADTAISELNAEKSGLTGQHGGAVTQSFTDFGQLGAALLAATYNRGETKLIGKDIESAKQLVAKERNAPPAKLVPHDGTADQKLIDSKNAARITAEKSAATTPGTNTTAAQGQKVVELLGQILKVLSGKGSSPAPVMHGNMGVGI